MEKNAPSPMPQPNAPSLAHSTSLPRSVTIIFPQSTDLSMKDYSPHTIALLLTDPQKCHHITSNAKKHNTFRTHPLIRSTRHLINQTTAPTQRSQPRSLSLPSPTSAKPSYPRPATIPTRSQHVDNWLHGPTSIHQLHSAHENMKSSDFVCDN
jgi:hypothetical protein